MSKMLRLDTRLGPNTGDYDAVTPTQARLASDLSLFDTFMPAAPPMRQSPPPVRVASPVSEEALVFIHPPTATAPQHQNPAATSTPRQASLAQTNASGDGRPIRQNSYPTAASNVSVNAAASSGAEASSSQYGARTRSASTGVSLSNADLSFFPQSFYNYTAAAQTQNVAGGSPNLQPNLGYQQNIYGTQPHNTAGHPSGSPIQGPYDASQAMQDHASTLSATCLPNHLSFAHYQQQLQQQQPLLHAPRTIYSRQMAQPAAHPQIAAPPNPYYDLVAPQPMYTPAYYHQQQSNFLPNYTSSSASAYSESLTGSSAASSTSSPAASYSTLEDEHASTPSSQYSQYQQPVAASMSGDFDVEQVLRAASISGPTEVQSMAQQESLFGKAPRKARRNTSGSSSGSSGTPNENTKQSSRSRSHSEVDSDGHNSERGKRFTCTYAGCNKSFSRNFNLSTHYNTHLGIKPFACPNCPKTFSRRHDCARHVAAVHTPSASKASQRSVSSDDGYGHHHAGKRTCGDECGCASGAHSRDVDVARADLLQPSTHHAADF